MDVPLMMVLEFIILLGYDGQLEQSEMEKELFTSAINQLKERFNILFYNFEICYSKIFRNYTNGFLESWYKKTEMTTLENALIWLYVKSWGKFGEHVIEEKDLWKFDESDLDTAMIGLAYPRKRTEINGEDITERVQALNELIMEKFEEGGLAAFRQWSFEIHDQAIATLPESVPIDEVDQQLATYNQEHPTLIKILEWDPSEFLKHRTKYSFFQDG